MSQNNGFRHFRNLSRPGQIHQINNKGGVTMAFEAPKHINDLTEDDEVRISFSFCSLDDNFERTVARATAQERLDQNIGYTIPGTDFLNLLHAPTAQCLLQSSLATQLEGDSLIEFRSKVKRAAGRKPYNKQ